jgi:hypothetical protein
MKFRIALAPLVSLFCLVSVQSAQAAVYSCEDTSVPGRMAELDLTQGEWFEPAVSANSRVEFSDATDGTLIYDLVDFFPGSTLTLFGGFTPDGTSAEGLAVVTVGEGPAETYKCRIK